MYNTMADEGGQARGGTNFRQQAVATANLLLEAASRMESISDTTSSSASRNQPHNSHTPNRCPTPVGTPTTCSASGSELWNLFNWTVQAPIGGKRKRRPGSAPPAKSSPRIATWTHTWVCMSCISDDTVPDDTDRVTLKLAGLGEKPAVENLSRHVLVRLRPPL